MGFGPNEGKIVFMQRIRLKHLRAIRWFHWINFPLLAVMIWSGLLIYWAYTPYRLGSFHFFPNRVYSVFNMDHRLAEGMALHFVFMWLFAINGIAYVAYTLFSGEWRFLVPRSPTVFAGTLRVIAHDLGFVKDRPEQEKYNDAQKLSYTMIILMGGASLLSGLAIYKPVQFGWARVLCGGYPNARAIHFALTMGYVLFFAIHIIQVLRAGWKNFLSMVTGYEQLAPEPETVRAEVATQNE